MAGLAPNSNICSALCISIAATPALPVSSPAPTLVVCSVPHMASMCQSSPKAWGRERSPEWVGICTNIQKLLCWRDAAYCTTAMHGFFQVTCDHIQCAQGVLRHVHLQKGLQPPCRRLPTPALTYHCLKHAVVLWGFFI